MQIKAALELEFIICKKQNKNKTKNHKFEEKKFICKYMTSMSLVLRTGLASCIASCNTATLLT